MFRGATWYLTPGRASSGVLYDRLHRLLVELGARPVAIDAAHHDRLMATVSHLPHVLANVLVEQAAATVDDAESLPRVGPSFRDMTRVAGANSAIWTDIYRSNADAITAAIEDTRDSPRRGRARCCATAIRTRSPPGTGAARTERERQLAVDGARGSGQGAARVGAEPSRHRRRAGRRARAGVNIVDIALAPAPDNRSGADQLLDRRRPLAQACPRADRGARLRRRGGAMRRRFEPASQAARHRDAAARQVDLPPRGSVRRDVRRAGDRAPLPGRARTPAQRSTAIQALGAGIDQPAADALLIRGVGLRTPAPTTQGGVWTSATPAPCCGCCPGGSRARAAAAGRSTATRRSAGARSTGSPARCS